MFGLLRIRDFGVLWLAGLISFAGDAALIIALPLHVYRQTDSTLATAGVLAATFLPRVLLGSVAGVFVDQWDRKWTMVIADSTRAVFLLPVLVAPNQLAVLYTVAAIQGTIGMFFRPAEGALLPKLVGEEHLVAANALNSLNNNFGALIGPAMGSLLYAKSGIGGAVFADALTFVVSAILIASITTDSRPERDSGATPVGAAWSRMGANWRAGLGIVRRNETLRVLFGASILTGLAEGVFLTLGLSPLVLDVLGGTPAQVGWLLSAQAVGGLIAGMIVVRAGRRITTRWLVGGGMIGIGLADLGAANARRIAAAGTPAVGVAMGFFVLAGFPSVAGVTGQQTIIQRQASDAYRGRVFGALGSLQGIAMMVGFGAGGLLGDYLGLVGILSAAALLRVIGGIGALALMPHSDTTQQSPPADSGLDGASNSS